MFSSFFIWQKNSLTPDKVITTSERMRGRASGEKTDDLKHDGLWQALAKSLQFKGLSYKWTCYKIEKDNQRDNRLGNMSHLHWQECCQMC